MRKELVEALREPTSGERFVLQIYQAHGEEILEGLLAAPGGELYPIVDGIPRILPDAFDDHPDFVRRYRAELARAVAARPSSARQLEFARAHAQTKASFGHQWTTFDVAEVREDTATFLAKTGFTLEALRGKWVLDAGCGSGRYSRLVAAAGARLIALDLSQAVAKTKELTRGMPNVEILQGNLMEPPLQRELFDYIFSIGVLIATPNTRQAFGALVPLLKPGGHMAIWVYRKPTRWQAAINAALRRRTAGKPFETLRRIATAGAILGGIPVIKHLSKIVNFSTHPRFETRVCDTFDWYSPQYQWFHSEAEVIGWFRNAGLEQIRLLPPEKSGPVYDWTYRHDLLIGSGVNVTARKTG